MAEPALDLSEIIGLYKDDARRSVGQMRDAVAKWPEMAANGEACQQLRRLAHQLRGSGRTYGFRGVSRIGKAMEQVIIKLQAKRLPADERLRTFMQVQIERLAEIFK